MCPGCTSAGGSIRKISPTSALAIAELKRTLGGSDASTQIVRTLSGQFGLKHVTSALWLGCRHLPVIGSVGRSFELCRVPPLDTPVAAGDGQCHHRRCRCVVSARGMERHCPHFGSRTGPYRCRTGPDCGCSLGEWRVSGAECPARVPLRAHVSPSQRPFCSLTVDSRPNSAVRWLFWSFPGAGCRLSLAKPSWGVLSLSWGSGGVAT